MSENLIKFADATNNEIFDPEWNGGEWMVAHVETHETIEQFIESSNNWAERTAPKFGEIGGFKFVTWASCQAVKGQTRDSMSVVDLGDIRIALPGTDLTNF